MTDTFTNALQYAEPLLNLRDQDNLLVVRGKDLYRLDPRKLKTEGRIVDWDVGGRMTPQVPRMTANSFSLQNGPRVRNGHYINAKLDNGNNVITFDDDRREDGFGWGTFNGVLPSGGRYWLILKGNAAGGTAIPGTFKLQFGSDPATLINNPASALASVEFFTDGPTSTRINTHRAGSDNFQIMVGDYNVLLIDLERELKLWGPGQSTGRALSGPLGGSRLHVTAVSSRRNIVRSFKWQAQRQQEALIQIPDGYSPLRMMNSSLPEGVKDGDLLRVTSPGVFNNAILKGGDMLQYRLQDNGEPILLLLESADQTTPASRHAVERNFTQLDSENAVVTKGKSLYMGPITSKYRNPLLQNLTDANESIVLTSVLPLLNELKSSFISAPAAQKLASAQASTIVASQSYTDAVKTNDLIAFGHRQALGVKEAKNTVLIGSEVMNTSYLTRSIESSIVIGSQALLSDRGPETKSIVRNTVAIGIGALFQADGSNFNTAIGHGVALGLTNANHNVAVGDNAFYEGLGDDNVAIGHDSMKSFVVRGEGARGQNTAIGAHALKIFDKDLVNATAIGYNAQVSGSHQLQLGDARTNVYSYQPMQQRCDRRDKADVVNTRLGLDFILALRPVEHRYDFREDYIDFDSRPVPPKSLRPEPLFRRTDSESPTYQAELIAFEADHNAWRLEVVQYSEDLAKYRRDYNAWEATNKISNIVPNGSKKRSRLHQSFLADEVRNAASGLNVEFGGYQDHSINGGEDVKSLAMDEFIPPIVKAIQELHQNYSQKLSLLEFSNKDAFIDSVAARVLAMMKPQA